MKLLALIGALVVVGLCAFAAYYLIENVTLKKGKRK